MESDFHTNTLEANIRGLKKNIKKAKELLSVNKGEENKMYAQTKWNTSAISRQLAEVYRCLKNE